MKKIWIVLFAAIAIGGLSACGGGGGSATPSVQTPPATETPPETPETPQPTNQARVINFGENENQFLSQYAPSNAELPDRGGVLTLTLSQQDYDALRDVLAEYRERRPLSYSFEYRSRHEAEQVLGRLHRVTADIYELAQVHTAPASKLGFTPGENGGTVQISLSRFHADRLEKLRDDYRYTEANPMTNTLDVCAPHIWGHNYVFPNLETTYSGNSLGRSSGHSCHSAHDNLRGRFGNPSRDLQQRYGKYGIGTIDHIATTTITRATAVIQMVEYRTTTRITARGEYRRVGHFGGYREFVDHFHTVVVAELRPSHSCLTEGNCVEQGYSTFLQIAHEGHTLILLAGSSSVEITQECEGTGIFGSRRRCYFSHSGFDGSRPIDPTIDPGAPQFFTGGVTVGDAVISFGSSRSSLYPTEYAATTLTALPEDVVALFAPPKPKHYYTLETRDDDAWADAGNDFAFNLRGVISQGAIRAGGFMFVGDEPMRNAHLEYRADPMTLSGVRIFADGGFKYENEGKTQAHYAKAMAVHRLFGASDNDDADADTNAREFVLDLYSSAAVGKVHSDYYEDSHLYGFAAGMFAARVFGITDEWHLRIRRPLSAREINPLLFGVDVRIGENNSQWRFGSNRDLGNGEFGVSVKWWLEF